MAIAIVVSGVVAVVAVVMGTTVIVTTMEVIVAARVTQMILNPVHRPIIDMFYKMTIVFFFRCFQQVSILRCQLISS